MGHQADLMNLQEQIDHTYVRGPLPKHVDAATPTPLVIRPKVGQLAPDEN
jgi:hypothetical protein